MSRLLYIQASPRGQRSYSVRVANAFVEEFKKRNPGDEVTILDVFKKTLPEFDAPAVEAKYAVMHGKEYSEQQLQNWKKVEQAIKEFTSADKYVFAVPMWNFGIPYKLKQYIDILVQPGYTFTYSQEKGYEGLVTGKPAFVAYSRGGQYNPGSGAEAFDLQKQYIELILGFIGFKDIHSVVVEPTLQGGEDTAQEKLDEAIAKAKKIASGF